jgi:hypothetical protein
VRAWHRADSDRHRVNGDLATLGRGPGSINDPHQRERFAVSRRWSWRLGLIAVVVLAGLAPLLLTLFWSRPPAEAGHRACEKVMHHSGSFTSSELREYSGLFAQAEDQQVKQAGAEWVVTEADSDTQFVRDTRLVLLGQQCERIGVKG